MNQKKSIKNIRIIQISMIVGYAVIVIVTQRSDETQP